MPRVMVTEAVQVGGRVLLPGEQDIEQATLDQLNANGRGHFVRSIGEQKTPEEQGDDASTNPLAEFPQLEGLTPEQVRAMSDDELDALPDVGPATVKKIREALA